MSHRNILTCIHACMQPDLCRHYIRSHSHSPPPSSRERQPDSRSVTSVHYVSLSQIWTLLDVVWYGSKVCVEISNHLHIHIFSIKPRSPSSPKINSHLNHQKSRTDRQGTGRRAGGGGANSNGRSHRPYNLRQENRESLHWTKRQTHNY